MKAASILKKASKVLDNTCKRELKRQGHNHTGALGNSINGEVLGTRALGTMLEYGYIVNDGTRPEKIPYGSNGGGGKSKYIEGLISFFKLKGLSEEEAKRAAFATAKVQKKEGMSTQSSKKYSKSGERQNFLDIAIKNAEPKVDEIVSQGIENIFDSVFTKHKDEVF